jgi:hypothetical protein
MKTGGAPESLGLPTARLNFAAFLNRRLIDTPDVLLGGCSYQWMFLRLAEVDRAPGEAARPMRTVVVAAAFMAMMLNVGSIAILLELSICG